MRKLISLSLLLIFMLCYAPPITTEAAPPDRAERKARHKKGAEVGKRIRQLRKYNKNIQRALADFERNTKRNGHAPKIDEAESFTLDPAGGTAALNMATTSSPFRKVGYKPQDLSGYGLEVIVITTYEAPGEWHGTVIYNKFDPSGGYLGQYVANVIMGPDPTYTVPDVVLEISYDDGGAWLEYGDLSAYESLGDPGAGFEQPMTIARFKKAQFQPGRRAVGRRIVQNPAVRQYVKCTWGASAAGGITCGVVSAFFAGAPLMPCLLGAATIASSGCAIQTIFF